MSYASRFNHHHGSNRGDVIDTAYHILLLMFLFVINHVCIHIMLIFVNEYPGPLEERDYG